MNLARSHTLVAEVLENVLSGGHAGRGGGRSRGAAQAAPQHAGAPQLRNHGTMKTNRQLNQHSPRSAGEAATFLHNSSQRVRYIIFNYFLGMGLLPHWSSRYSADLTSHLTDSRLPSRAHEKSIEPSTRQTCKKSPLPAQYTVFREFTPHQLSLSRLRKRCLKSTTSIVLCRYKHHQGYNLPETLRFQRDKHLVNTR